MGSLSFGTFFFFAIRFTSEYGSIWLQDESEEVGQDVFCDQVNETSTDTNENFIAGISRMLFSFGKYSICSRFIVIFIQSITAIRLLRG